MSEMSVETKAELYDRIVALVLGRLVKAESAPAKSGQSSEAEAAVLVAAVKAAK